MLFKRFKYRYLIKRFNKTCSIIESKPTNIPDKLISGSRLGDEFNYLDSCDIDKILIETFNFYSSKFNNLIQNIDSYQFFDNFLTFYEYYSQVRFKIRFVNFNTAQRIRFIHAIIEEAVKLKLKSSRKPESKNYELIGELYECFININLISNKLSINTILNIQSAHLEKRELRTEIQDSGVHSLNLKIAFDFINQCSKERYLHNEYINLFFNVLSEKGLEEHAFYNKISELYKQSFSDGKLSLDRFKEILKKQGYVFEQLMLGLLLEKEQINSISNRIRKPYETPRHLTYPFPVWEIDNEKYVIIENRAFIDSIEYVIGDLLCFGKMPSQWREIFSNSHSDDFNQGTDFEDKIEFFLKENKIPFLREMNI